MAIIEIWVPELIVVFFLVLPLIRPFVKNLWSLDGLTWLPLIALGIAIGIFPAYGFRPECLPILVFALVYSIANFFPVVSGASTRPNDSFRDRGPVLTVCAFILLSAAAIPMFAFSSRVDLKPEGEAEMVKVLKTSTRTRDYFLRVYGAVQADRPLIFLVPQEIGSVASVNLVCTELQKKNFTVVTYFYRDTKSPRKDTVFYPAKLLAHWYIFRNAAIFASANERGKTLEADRRAEIEYLLSRLPSVLGKTGTAMPPLLLVGYGTGGSALAYLAGESSFISTQSNVRGVVAIESRLWSSYLPEPRHVRVSPISHGIILRQWTNFVRRLDSIWPQRVSRTGPLPVADPSVQGFPVLYLVSGRALDSSGRQKHYQAIFDALRSGPGPAALAAIEGAGPLDYQDYPFTHPIYSFLFPGLKGAEKSEDPLDDTAGIIGNFASQLLEQAEISPPPRQAINGRLYVESKGLPGFHL
jgi:hypothetical protein